MKNGMWVIYDHLMDAYECMYWIGGIFREKPAAPPLNENGYWEYTIAFVPYEGLENIESYLYEHEEEIYEAMDKEYPIPKEEY